MARSAQRDQVPTVEEAIIARRRMDEIEDSRRRFVDTMIIRESTRMAITASHSEFIDQGTGEVHHHAVKIEAIRKANKRDGGDWIISQPSTIWINDSGEDEIIRLRDYLSVVRDQLPEEAGEYLVVRVDQGAAQLESLRRLIQLASASGKAEALVQSVEAVSTDTEALDRLIEFTAKNPQAIEIASAALNIGRYIQALDKLRALIDEDVPERDLQSHLTDNYWLFGTEYSELLDLRHATRDEQQDFIVRRTTDNYIEIIEIKTPLGGQQLFRYDQSHDSYYAGRELSKVVGQVIKYIEKLESNRQMLLVEDGLDTNKIRAKIVIGRNSDQSQLEALRNYNGHLHRIEILTFDQLVNIGQRVLDHLQAVLQSTDDDAATESEYDPDELPF